MAHSHDHHEPASETDPLRELGLCLRGERVLDSRLTRRLTQAGIDLWNLPLALAQQATELSLDTRRFGLA